MKEENDEKTMEKYSLPSRVSQLNSGDDSVLIDLGRIRTEEEINSHLDNAIKERQKEKNRDL